MLESASVSLSGNLVHFIKILYFFPNKIENLYFIHVKLIPNYLLILEVFSIPLKFLNCTYLAINCGGKGGAGGIISVIELKDGPGMN